MNDCPFDDKLSDFLDGHLEPAEEQALRRHLESDPACGCAEELQGLRDLVAGLRGLPPGPPPEGGWDRVEAALGATNARRPAPSAVLAWAASLVLGAVLLAWAFLQLAPAPADPAPAALPEEAASPLHRPDVRWQVLAAATREEFPPLRVRDETLVRYGSELQSLDSLIELARTVPGPTQDDEFRRNLDRLTLLRDDLLTEMVLQAQAERIETWQ
jgi:hypothetical protein